jgi:hypothetical protein
MVARGRNSTSDNHCAIATVALPTMPEATRPVMSPTMHLCISGSSRSTTSLPGADDSHGGFPLLSGRANHPLRKLLRTHHADCHCRPRPAGAETSVWKTKKAANKRVTRCPSGIRFDWSGNRTGNSRTSASAKIRQMSSGRLVQCVPSRSLRMLRQSCR